MQHVLPQNPKLVALTGLLRLRLMMAWVSSRLPCLAAPYPIRNLMRPLAPPNLMLSPCSHPAQLQPHAVSCIPLLRGFATEVGPAEEAAGKAAPKFAGADLCASDRVLKALKDQSQLWPTFADDLETLVSFCSVPYQFPRNGMVG